MGICMMGLSIKGNLNDGIVQKRKNKLMGLSKKGKIN
jgi:hypothetical protein